MALDPMPPVPAASDPRGAAPPGGVGVLLVGGFLGAGKTTLVERLVRDPRVGGRLAVLVNELGALGLDGDLIRDARETAALRTVQLDSGCVCCTLKGELGQALTELARPAEGPPPAQIVVELSGAALASEVHFQISTQALDAPYHPDGLVCLVDAHAAPRWAREAEALFVDQLSRADLVLLSKLDRATPTERTEAERLIAALAPTARVAPCLFGEVDPALLLGGFEVGAPASRRAGAAHALVGETLPVPGPLDEGALVELLEALSPGLFRIKGVVDVRDGAGERTVVVQCVGDQIAFSPAGPGAAAGARRLTFIGPRVDLAAVAARLARAA